MKYIKLFENFGEEGIPATKISDREYWKDYDYEDGETADRWANDPGYQSLEKILGVPLEFIMAYNSESDDVEEYKSEIERMRPSEKIISNQEYLGAWKYYPESLIAVARGEGGAPDWFFVFKPGPVEFNRIK
jgi:hypothetical protein